MNLTRLITLSLLSACTSSQSQTVSKSGSDTNSPQGPADSPGADEDTAATEDTDTGQDPEPDPVDIELILSLDPDCAMCVTAHIAQEETGLVTIYAGEQGSSLAPWVTFDANLEDTVPVLELHAETTYELKAQRVDTPSVQSEVMTITTAPLPSDFPPINLTAAELDESQPGVTLMTVVEWTGTSTMHSNFLVAVDGDGEVVWYHRLHGLNLGLYVDEHRRIYTTQTALQAIRVDPYGQTVTEWNVEDLGIESTHHEIRPLPDGGLATLTTEMRPIAGWNDGPSGWSLTFEVIGDIFATFDAMGHMTWSWSLLDHFDPLEHHTNDLHMTFWMMPPYDDLTAPKDWSHGNAMVPNGGSWLGSFRNLDWLIQVNPDNDQVDWIFGPGGDFELAEGSRWFSRQHAPAVQPGGSILMYDNGNDRADREAGEQPFSRVVEYELNHETGVATELWSWDGGLPRTYCPIVGDVDTLENGNHLITDGAIYAGTIYTEDVIRPHFSGRVREIKGTEDPQIVWELEVGNPDDTDKTGWLIYRAIRVDSLYPPYATP